ncbi:MAG: YceI family protein [Planctomycetes bacterium]|nr:YceI family protein [Planctomycetota bacterium]
MPFRMLVATAVTILLAGQVSAQDVKLDKEKSTIEFVGKKTEAGKEVTHPGGFKEFTADLKINWETPEQSTLVIEIKTDSIFSDDKKLTEHLKQPDFFDVKKHPTIKFESTKLEMKGESEAVVTGKLTMLGKTVEIVVPTKSEMSDTALTVNAEFSIDRTKWGMNYGLPKVDGKVQLKAKLHYTR